MSKDDGSANVKPPGDSQDVALIHGVTPEGDLRVIRKRGEQLELGAVRALREGVPIVGDVVRLTPRKEFPLLCDVTTELSVAAPATLPAPAAVAPAPAPPRALEARPRKGPAQVATEEYRRNWEQIWSTKPRSRLSN